MSASGRVESPNDGPGGVGPGPDTDGPDTDGPDTDGPDTDGPGRGGHGPPAWLYRAGAVVAGGLPGRWSVALAEAAGRASAILPTPAGVARRALVERHLRRVHGRSADPALIAREVRRAFASYGRYWVETLRLARLPGTAVRAGVRFEGLEHLDAALEGGRGAIVALPHLGGWEWGGRGLLFDGYQVSVVVEPLAAPEVFEWFVRFRTSLGFEIIPAGEGAAFAILRALRASHVVCLLADRIVGGGAGVGVSFFDEVTELPAGPALLSLRSGAPLLPAAVYFGDEPGEHLAVIRPPVQTERRGPLAEDVADGTQRLARELEHLIARAPAQWHLFQPNWPSDR